MCIDQNFIREGHGFYYAFPFSITDTHQCNKYNKINKIEDNLETEGLVAPGLSIRMHVRHAADPTVVNMIHVNNMLSE